MEVGCFVRHYLSLLHDDYVPAQVLCPGIREAAMAVRGLYAFFLHYYVISH